MKLTIILTLFVILLAPWALAETGDADVGFTFPTPVVYDVPFPMDVQVNSHNVQFIDYDLSVGSDNNKAIFTAGLSRADNFQFVSSLSGPQGNGATYRVRTETNGNTFTSNQAKRLFSLSNVKFTGIQQGGSKIVLKSAPQKTVTAVPGSTITAVNGVDSVLITPSLSTCGDGVVGYFDADSDGVKDTNEKEEACDTGAVQVTGCHACEYIEIGYKGTNCWFGSGLCVVDKMDARELLREKLNALLSNQCYPNAQHPDKLYCDSTGTFEVDYANFGPATKISLIAKIAAALTQYFDSVLR